MIAHEGEAAAVGIGGQIFQSLDFQLRIQEIQTTFEPRNALFVANDAQEVVHLILVEAAFEPRHDKAGDALRFRSCLGAQDFIDVYLKGGFVGLHDWVGFGLGCEGRGPS